MNSSHLATYETDAAVRAHLAFEHAIGLAILGLNPLEVPLPFAVHLLLTDEHSQDPEEERP